MKQLHVRATAQLNQTKNKTKIKNQKGKKNTTTLNLELYQFKILRSFEPVMWWSFKWKT